MSCRPPIAGEVTISWDELRAAHELYACAYAMVALPIPVERNGVEYAAFSPEIVKRLEAACESYRLTREQVRERL